MAPDPDTSPAAAPYRRLEIRLAWILGGVLVALHLVLSPQSTDLLLGWVPVELAVRVGWMLLAWLYLEWFTRRVWGAVGTRPAAPSASTQAGEEST